MMDRRDFLKLTGSIAAASALGVSPVSAAGAPPVGLAGSTRDLGAAGSPSGASLIIREPGTYQISGFVRLEQPLVEIGGITNTQWVSWSDAAGSGAPVASFTTFEHFDRAGMTPDIRVLGGSLESVAVVPLDFE
jgi:TAT (twin-arginine translocation) pathway signal sequence